MRPCSGIFISLSSAIVASCGGLEFGQVEGGGVPPGALAYYDAVPAMVVATGGDCSKTVTATAVADSAHPRWAKMNAGIGSTELGVTLDRGMLASVNQKTDPKIAETLTAIGGLVPKPGVVGSTGSCTPSVVVYVLKDGNWTAQPLP